MNDIKYCEDCKHKAPVQIGVYEIHCMRPELAGAHALVCRHPSAFRLPKCSEMRGSDVKCGSSGMFFEPRPPEPPRKWWKIWG